MLSKQSLLAAIGIAGLATAVPQDDPECYKCPYDKFSELKGYPKAVDFCSYVFHMPQDTYKTVTSQMWVTSKASQIATSAHISGTFTGDTATSTSFETGVTTTTVCSSTVTASTSTLNTVTTSTSTSIIVTTSTSTSSIATDAASTSTSTSTSIVPPEISPPSRTALFQMLDCPPQCHGNNGECDFKCSGYDDDPYYDDIYYSLLATDADVGYTACSCIAEPTGKCYTSTEWGTQTSIETPWTTLTGWATTHTPSTGVTVTSPTVTSTATNTASNCGGVGAWMC